MRSEVDKTITRRSRTHSQHSSDDCLNEKLKDNVRRETAETRNRRRTSFDERSGSADETSHTQRGRLHIKDNVREILRRGRRTGRSEVDKTADHETFSVNTQSVSTQRSDDCHEIEKLKDNVREMARRETALRREIEDALLLTGYGRSEVDKTADHETFSVNTQSVSTQRSDDCHEIEKLKDNVREMARRETALRREIEDALLLTGYGRSEVDKTADHETFSVNTQSVSTQRSDDCHEIEKLKDNVREMARRETALRREIEDALLLTGHGRSEVDKTADHETFSVNTQSVSTQRSDDCHEIEKLKDSVREMARRETALRREIEDALLLTGHGRSEVDKTADHETFSVNTQSVSTQRSDDSHEIEKLKDSVREMARRETALRREIEDALLLTGYGRSEVDKTADHETFSVNTQSVSTQRSDDCHEIEKLKDNVREMARRETALRREIEDALLLTGYGRSEVDKTADHETFSVNTQSVSTQRSDDCHEIEKLKDNVREMARRETALRREIEDALLLTGHGRSEVDKTADHETFSVNTQSVSTQRSDDCHEIEKLKDNVREMARRETALRREIEDALLLTGHGRSEVDKIADHETFSVNTQSVSTQRSDDCHEIEKLKDNVREMARRETALRREIEDALLLTGHGRSEVDKTADHETFSVNTQSVSTQKSDDCHEIEKLKDNVREMARRETALRREIEDALLLTGYGRSEVDKTADHETFSVNTQSVSTQRSDDCHEIEKLKDNVREMARRETALRREIEDALLLTGYGRSEVDKTADHETFSVNTQSVSTQRSDDCHEIEKLKDNVREMARRETALRREIEDALLLTGHGRSEVDKTADHETFSVNTQSVSTQRSDDCHEIEKLKDSVREMARRETALRREIEDALLLTGHGRSEVDKTADHETFSVNTQSVSTQKSDDSKEGEGLKQVVREMAQREAALRLEIEDAGLLSAFLRTEVDRLRADGVKLALFVEEDAFSQPTIRSQSGSQYLEANTRVEKSLRLQIEELVMAEHGAATVGKTLCDDVVGSESAHSTVCSGADLSGTLDAAQQVEQWTKGISEEELNNLGLITVSKSTQSQMMSKVERASRSELEEVMLQTKLVNCDPSKLSGLQTIESEPYNSGQCTRTVVECCCKTTERALRSEVEELLITSDVATIGLNEAYRHLSDSNNALRAREKQIENAVRSHEKLDDELRLVKSQLSASQPLAEKAISYEQLLKDREAEIIALAEKLRDFAVRFDEQAADFQREIRRVKTANVSDKSTAKLLTEIVRLNKLLDREQGRKSYCYTLSATDQNIELDFSVKTEDVDSLVLGSRCTLDVVDHLSSDVRAPVSQMHETKEENENLMKQRGQLEANAISSQCVGDLQKENMQLKKINDDLQKVIAALRKTVFEQSLYLEDNVDTNALTAYSVQLQNFARLIEKTVKQNGLLEKSLRHEVEELLTICERQPGDLKRDNSNDHEDFIGRCSHLRLLERLQSAHKQQQIERGLRLEIEELLMKTSTFNRESLDSLSAVSAVRERSSLNKSTQQAEYDQLTHSFPKMRQSRTTTDDLSIKMIPLVCIESTSSCSDDLNLRVQRLTAELNQKDEKFEEERKRLSGEIEGLRKELADVPKRRASGIEKSNDLMIAQMEIQISLLQERLKDYENLKEDNENLKMENCRLKAEVEKERLKGARRPSTPQNSSSDDEVVVTQSIAPCKSEKTDAFLLRKTDGHAANDNYDAVFEEISEKHSPIHSADDFNFVKKQLSETADLQHENDLLRGEMAVLTQELEKQKSIASNMLAPIPADDEIFAHQLSALHVKVKDLTEQKIVLAGKSSLLQPMEITRLKI
jgi:hypothetical protein